MFARSAGLGRVSDGRERSTVSCRVALVEADHPDVRVGEMTDVEERINFAVFGVKVVESNGLRAASGIDL